MFVEGPTTPAAQSRYQAIRTALESGWLTTEIQNSRSKMSETLEMTLGQQSLLRTVVESVTANEGRAVAGLCILLSTIKAICPEQSVRLHKGSARGGAFTWMEGVPMRVLDKDFITPALRTSGLLQLNADGIFMTRTLAENYPYTRFYKAAVKGAKDEWLSLVDMLELREIDAKESLQVLLGMLWNQSDEFDTAKLNALDALNGALGTFHEVEAVRRFFQEFLERATYSARLFEIALHSLFQVFHDLSRLGPNELKPLSQMRSANKKHGNVGDIEVVEPPSGPTSDIKVLVAWDAKFGKLDLEREVLELKDKLNLHSEVKEAGFVVEVDHVNVPCPEFLIEGFGKIQVMGFDKWTQHIMSNFGGGCDQSEIADKWLEAFVQSLCQMRRDLAPIDEPSVEWLREFTEAINDYAT
jgi:hypothetical protein